GPRRTVIARLPVLSQAEILKADESHIARLVLVAAAALCPRVTLVLEVGATTTSPGDPYDEGQDQGSTHLRMLAASNRASGARFIGSSHLRNHVEPDHDRSQRASCRYLRIGLAAKRSDTPLYFDREHRVVWARPTPRWRVQRSSSRSSASM